MADIIPDSTKLADCPFCGGKAYRGRTTYSRALEDAEWADGSPIIEAHFINCSACHGTNQGGPFGGYQTPKRAIAAWNTRAAPPAMDREAVKEALFLLDRLADFKREITDDEVFTHFNGHVSPSAARLRMALSTLSADAIRQGEGVWRHVKRGTLYEVIGTAELQAGQAQLEHAELVIYRGEDGKLWARNSGEFHDGRFVPATPASHASDGGKA